MLVLIPNNGQDVENLAKYNLLDFSIHRTIKTYGLFVDFNETLNM